MQLYELVDVAPSPSSPGSRPPKPQPFDPIPVATETCEQVHTYQQRAAGPPSPSRVGFAADVKDNDGEEEEDSGMLSTSRRADSVASCASEWVNQRTAVRSEAENELAVGSRGGSVMEPPDVEKLALS